MRLEFSKKVKLAAFRRARGRCEACGALLVAGKFQYDHITPAAFDGGNDLANVHVVCLACHGEKTYQHDIPAVAKSNRILKRHAGIRKDRTIRAWRNFRGEIVTKPRER